MHLQKKKSCKDYKWALHISSQALGYVIGAQTHQWGSLKYDTPPTEGVQKGPLTYDTPLRGEVCKRLVQHEELAYHEEIHLLSFHSLLHTEKMMSWLS